MRDFTTTGPMEGPRIHVEPEPVKESLTTDADLLEAVEAFIEAMDCKAEIPEEEDQQILDQRYEALVFAYHVARGKA